MNKRFFFTCTMMALMLSGANAQSKLTLSARMLLEGTEMGSARKARAQSATANRVVLASILLEKGATVTDAQLAEMDIKVAKRLNNLLLAYVPVNQLANLAEAEGVSLVDAGNKQRLNNDRSREASFVPMVHDMTVANSPADMPVQYRGKDVLVGIIDTGIDLGHPAFRDANGKSRIKQATLFDTAEVVDEETGEKKLEILHQTYTEDQMEQAIEDTMDMPARGGGHGTHVTGIAAGSTVALPDDDPMKPYYGMAPEADILTYELPAGYDQMMLLSLADAFDKADEWHQPVVMNLSWGSNSSRLDGTDMFTRSLNELVSSYDMSGKIICYSAGNEGDYLMSAQMSCDNPIKNNEWTFQHCVNFDLETEKVAGVLYSSEAGIDFYGADCKDYAVRYDFFDYVTGEYIASSPLMATSDCQEDALIYENVNVNEAFSLRAEAKSEVSSAGRMYMETYLDTESHVKVFANAMIFTKTEGVQIDAAITIGEFDNVSTNTVEPNSWGSFNISACNDHCISVGSYNTRSKFTTPEGKTYKTNDEGDISYFSSYRHPHYGDMGPIVATPGAFILSSYHHNLEREGELIMSTTQYNGVEHLWGIKQGTSMAAPAATGIIALWLQANPQLTREDIIDILANTCDYDEFCQNSPYHFGYGKINAKRGIDYILDQTVGLTSVGNDAVLQTSKYIDANGRIMIRKGEHSYDVMGVERR